MSPKTHQAIPIEQIIQQDEPELLVKQAELLAQQLRSDEASKTQVRKLYGTMKQIELSWPVHVKTDDERQARDDAYRELILFKPRLAYQGEKHPALRPLTKTIQRGIDAVGKDRRRLQRLSQFFEATLAYYVATPYRNPSRKGGRR